MEVVFPIILKLKESQKNLHITKGFSISPFTMRKMIFKNGKRIVTFKYIFKQGKYNSIVWQNYKGFCLYFGSFCCILLIDISDQYKIFSSVPVIEYEYIMCIQK